MNEVLGYILGLIAAVIGGVFFQKKKMKSKAKLKTQETKHEIKEAENRINNSSLDDLVSRANTRNSRRQRHDPKRR